MRQALVGEAARSVAVALVRATATRGKEMLIYGAPTPSRSGESDASRVDNRRNSGSIALYLALVGCFEPSIIVVP